MASTRFLDRTSSLNVVSLQKAMLGMPAALKQMGFTALREGQKKIIPIIAGERDILAVMPTAQGKSACFILPTLALGWRTMVCSPLLSLMRDQVQKLWGMGVRAGQLSSDQGPAENARVIQSWISGELQLIYVSPERILNPAFKDAVRQMPPQMVVIDEAHCLSGWSDNFRPAYCTVGDYISENKPLVVAAFTATCPPEVEADVRRVLGLKNALKIDHYERRENLDLTSMLYTGDTQIANILRDRAGPAVVYCSTVARVYELAEYLSLQFKGGEVVAYTGEMPDAQKRANQDAFMEGKARICVATNAFGMGVDKEDIVTVIHRDIPANPEALSQEVGRGGRGGQRCYCATLYAKDSKSTQEFFFRNGFPTTNDIREVIAAYKRLADPATKICSKSIKEVASASNINDRLVMSVRQALLASQVLVKADRGEKICTVCFKGTSESKRFLDWSAMVQNYGVRVKENVYEFTVDAIADAVALTPATVSNQFKKWQDLQLITFTPPSRVEPVKVVGDASMVDFKRLELKREAARKKLDLIWSYQDIPDADKHSFFEDYFKVQLPALS